LLSLASLFVPGPKVGIAMRGTGMGRLGLTKAEQIAQAEARVARTAKAVDDAQHRVVLMHEHLAASAGPHLHGTFVPPRSMFDDILDERVKAHADALHALDLAKSGVRHGPPIKARIGPPTPASALRKR
jgi:hypothetical protein